MFDRNNDVIARNLVTSFREKMKETGRELINEPGWLNDMIENIIYRHSHGTGLSPARLRYIFYIYFGNTPEQYITSQTGIMIYRSFGVLIDDFVDVIIRFLELVGPRDYLPPIDDSILSPRRCTAWDPYTTQQIPYAKKGMRIPTEPEIAIDNNRSIVIKSDRPVRERFVYRSDQEKAWDKFNELVRESKAAVGVRR